MASCGPIRLLLRISGWGGILTSPPIDDVKWPSSLTKLIMLPSHFGQSVDGIADGIVSVVYN